MKGRSNKILEIAIRRIENSSSRYPPKMLRRIEAAPFQTVREVAGLASANVYEQKYFQFKQERSLVSRNV